MASVGAEGVGSLGGSRTLLLSGSLFLSLEPWLRSALLPEELSHLAVDLPGTLVFGKSLN